MCGRYALKAPASKIAEVFAIDILPDLLPRYNVAPMTKVPVVVEGDDGKRALERFRWGLVPGWAKDRKIANKLTNARSETIREKPSFRSAFKRRRCLIVADGFYEWKTEGKAKRPHLIGMKEGEPFAMAGIWELWRDPETGEDHRTCSIITTGPNAKMVPIHDRMPVILPPALWDRWLSRKNEDTEALQELLVPCDPELIAVREVSDWVNSVKHQGESCQAEPGTAWPPEEAG